MLVRRFFCVSIIALGSCLEIYFYVFRFIGDGMILPAAIGAAVALELLLAFAVYNSHVSRWFVAVAVIVSLYATVQTSAGQTFSLLSHNETAVKNDSNALLIVEHENNLKRLALEADNINSQLSSVNKIEDRAQYGRTVYAATLRLEKINNDRMTSLKMISDLSGKQSESKSQTLKNMSVYDFYSSMPKWSSMDWLKFVFHSFLSVLITLMTPVGILSWTRKDEPKKMKFKKIDSKEIETFVRGSWYKIRQGTGSKILSEISLMDFLKREGVELKLGVYPDLYNRCLELNIINADGTILNNNEADVINKISGAM